MPLERTTETFCVLFVMTRVYLDQMKVCNKEEIFTRTDSAGTILSGLQPPELWETN